MVYLSYLSAGDHLIIFHDTYGANYKVSLILERLGVKITWLNGDDAKKIHEYIQPNTKMIFLETPSNPLCKIIDIAMIRKAADHTGVMVVADNTFATPYHQNPLKLGADLVIHSATKALGGHNDLMAGAVAGSKEHYNRLWFTRQAIGSTLDPYSAFLLDRGLKTFRLRMEAMSLNAQQTAEFLSRQSEVTRLMYPGLRSHPGHATALQQMHNGFGNMLAFNVGRHEEDAKRFISALKTIRHAVSLGSTESLICIPFLTTMLYLPPERRTTFGVDKNTVRLSIGIEPFEHILADLKQALAYL
jgi:cystathionine beta-lyase/cystathionine gamma-synthase